MLPQGLQLRQGALLEGRAVVREPLHLPEPPFEPAIRSGEGALAVETQMPREVDAREEQVTQLRLRSPGPLTGVEGFMKLADLFVELGEHPFRVGPVEAGGGRPPLQLHGPDEGRESHRHAVERTRLGGALARLDALPIRPLSGGVGIEYVRVTADHLGSERLDDVVEAEASAFACQVGMEHHLKQQIAQLVAERVEVLARDGVRHLVGLLDGVGGDRLERLRAIPRAVPAKPGHQLDEAFHPFLRRRAARVAVVARAAYSAVRAGRCGNAGVAGGSARAPKPSRPRRADRRWVAAAVCLLAFFGSAHAAAEAPNGPAAMTPAIARIVFLEAERALRQGRLRNFDRMSEALREHPLHPWLVFRRFRRDFPRRSEPEIESFLATVPGTPMADTVRSLWLDRLARQQRWDRFLEVHAEVPPNRLAARHRCHRARALLETGAERAGFEAAADLWLVPGSQDEACDRVFALWAKREGRTAEHLWERIDLALRHSNRSLARYVAGLLESPDHAVASRWIDDHHRPARLVSEAGRVANDPVWRRPVTAAVARLARRDPAAAAREWRKVSKRRSLPVELDAFASWRIGLGFAQDYRIREAASWLERVPGAHRNVRGLGVRALVSAAGGRWEDCLAALDALPPGERGKLRWRYWRARALDALGGTAERSWAELAAERDYYGFLAADRIGAPYRFRDHPSSGATERLDAVERTEGFRRARELHAIGHRNRFGREWSRLMWRLDAGGPGGPGDLAAAAELASRHGWHRKAIEAAAKAQAFDRLDLRFPVAWAHEVRSAAGTHGIDPAWVFATIRMESAFLPDARSPADARGLMQLLPGTARRIARATGIRYAGSRSLKDPETNIRLGAAFLRRLLDRMNGHPALASAAYNAGPQRAREWLAEAGEMEPDLWVDLIPFAETRQYVKRILEYRIVYQHRMEVRLSRMRDLLPPLPPVPD